MYKSACPEMTFTFPLTLLIDESSQRSTTSVSTYSKKYERHISMAYNTPGANKDELKANYDSHSVAKDSKARKQH